MAQDPKYGHEPPKNDDGSYKDQVGQFGFWYLLSDGHTVENVKTGTQYDLENIGGSSSDTHIDVTDDGSAVASDIDALDFGSNANATDNGDGTVTVGTTDTNTHTDISDGGTLVVGDVGDINFGSNVSVADDGDGTVTVSSTDTDTDTHTDVSDSGTLVVGDVGDINFGSNVSVADDGDGTVTVSSTDTDTTIRTREAQIVPTSISDASSAPAQWKRVPSGKTLKLLEAGVQDSTQSAPTGLTIEVYDLTNATTIMSKNALHVEGSPIASKSGAIDVEFRVANATGGSVDASGYVLYTME